MVTYINKNGGGGRERDDRISSIQIRRVKKIVKGDRKREKKKAGKHSLFSVVDIRSDKRKTQKPARDRVNGGEN